MLEITPAERRALRARAHPLQPVVTVGDAGLTHAVIAEADRALKAHELIKIRVTGAARDTRAAVLDRVCDALGAAPVQHIGRILVIFRPRPPQTEAKADDRSRKPRRRRQPAGRSRKRFRGS